MSVFKYSLGTWVDDHGQTMSLACIGRDVDSGAAIVHLHHDRESDTHLYGYWGNGIFAKVFVTEVRDCGDPDPMWAVRFGPVRYEPARAGEPSADECSTCLTQIVDALSQCPDGDVSQAVSGAVMRRIEVKHDWL